LALIKFTFFPNPKQNPFTANVDFPWRPTSVRDNISVVLLQPWTIPNRKFHRARTTNLIQAFDFYHHLQRKGNKQSSTTAT